MIGQYPQANNSTTTLIWRKTMSGGETSLSGYDVASQPLSYTPGQEQVYLNGILLVRGEDYTATSGTTITGLAALAAGDFIQVNAYNSFNLTTVLPASNILGTIANNQLTNSAITINGSAISLGGSVSSLVTLTGSETLTNKTLTSPSLNQPILASAEEKVNIVESAATGTVNIDALTASIWYYTSNANENHTLNFRADSDNTLNSILNVGDSITLAWLNTNGSPAYYPNVIQIDGSNVTPKWQGGSAPSSGNTNSVDVYTFTIIKTASATYTVLADVAKFA